MAFASDIRTGGMNLSSRLGALRNDVKTRVGQYRMYRTTLTELRSLSVRELDDLGLGQSDLVKIATDAAYA